MSDTMMKCGCVAQGVVSSTQAPVCMVHDCREPATEAPDLTGRMARCTYYGAKCKSEQPSATSLAFFSKGHGGNRVLGKTDKYDSFYCGCFGWD